MKDYKLLYAEENFDSSFRLKVYYKDAISMGPHIIRVLAEKGPEGKEEPKIILNEKIYNDGSNLRSSNVSIKWLKQAAELTIRGKEQDRKRYIIRLKGDEYEVILEEK